MSSNFLVICSKQSQTGTAHKGICNGPLSQHILIISGCAVKVVQADNLLIVMSRTLGDETSIPTQPIKNGEVFKHPDLNTDHEEADIQIIPHAVYVVRQSLFDMDCHPLQ